MGFAMLIIIAAVIFICVKYQDDLGGGGTSQTYGGVSRKTQQKINEELEYMAQVRSLFNRREENLSKCPEEKREKLTIAYNELATAYNNYGIHILRMPSYEKMPMSSITAAAVGSAIGGTAVGVAAAMQAKEKEEKVIQHNKEVDMAYYSKESLLSDLRAKYRAVLELL